MPLAFDIRLFALLFMSMGIDWMFQTNWEAENKFDSPLVRMIHASVYTVLTSSLLVIYGYLPVIYIVAPILLITHYIIDARIREFPSMNQWDG